MWEEEDFLNLGLSGKEHHEAVDTDTHARCWRHAIFQSAEEVLVDNHCLIVTAAGEHHLFLETCALVYRVVKLGIGVSHLLTINHQLETLGEFRVLAMAFAERRHLDRIICDESRLYIVTFAFCSEYLVNKFTFTHRRVHFDIELFAHLAQLSLVHAVDIDAGVLLDRVDHRDTFERTFKANLLIADHNLICTKHIHCAAVNHLFSIIHHPEIILIGDIYLKACKLRVMGAVHTLVAEVT